MLKLQLLTVVTLTFWAIQAAPTDDGPISTISEADMRKILKEYNKKAAVVSNRVGLADWAVATDVGNKEKEENLVR